MNILLNGSQGFMGREVVKLCHQGYRAAVLAAGVDMGYDGSDSATQYSSLDQVATTDEIDCIVDFSHHSATPALLEFAVRERLPLVLATTGHTDKELEMIKDASKSIPIFHSGNMSLGIALLIELAKTVALSMPEAEIEIIERHHNRKVDAPSGTALMLADAIRSVRPEAYNNCGRSGQGKREHSEIGIHSIRMGNIVGEHEVIIGTQNQTITLKHEAHNRALFAEGALAAAEFIIGMNPGLYSMPGMISHSDATEDAVFEAK